MAECPTVCHALHLPVQPGAVLERMRRGYPRALPRPDRDARRWIPDLGLSTHHRRLPGESPAEFDETLAAARRGFDQVYSFLYSPRPGTARRRRRDPVARGEGRLPGGLQALQQEIQLRNNRRHVGTEAEVLVDGWSRMGGKLKGRTAANRVVNFQGDPGWIGSYVQVHITAAGPNSLEARRIRSAGP